MILRTDFSLSKNALNLGALAGIILSVVQLFAYSTGLSESSVIQWIIYLTIILAISWGTRKYRDITGGYISYGQSLGFGVLLSLGASLIFAFSNYLYISFLNPEYIEIILNQMEIALYETGYDDEKVNMIMELYRSFFGPGMYAFALVFNFTFTGFLFSLVISFFVRNNKPLFDN